MAPPLHPVRPLHSLRFHLVVLLRVSGAAAAVAAQSRGCLFSAAQRAAPASHPVFPYNLPGAVELFFSLSLSFPLFHSRIYLPSAALVTTHYYPSCLFSPARPSVCPSSFRSSATIFLFFFPSLCPATAATVAVPRASSLSPLFCLYLLPCAHLSLVVMPAMNSRSGTARESCVARRPLNCAASRCSTHCASICWQHDEGKTLPVLNAIVLSPSARL